MNPASTAQRTPSRAANGSYPLPTVRPATTTDVGSPSGPRQGAFTALRVRNYRLYVVSQICTNTCGWMQRVAQDWLMLMLTGNVTLVGLTVTLQLGPMLLFGLWGGVVADRLDKRRILTVTQSLFAMSALTLGILTLNGAVQPWHILASASFLGFATVFDNPARQAFVPELVGRDRIKSAISINSTVFQSGALVGPALAGVGIALIGEGWAFVVNSAACLVAVSLLVAMRASEISPSPPVDRARGQLREGLAYVRRTPRIKWAVVLIGFVAITGVNLTAVLAAYADDVFDAGSGGYGALNSCLAAGALLGALASTRRRTLRLRTLVFGAAALGALQVFASVMRSPVVFGATLVLVGAALLLYLTAGNTLVQTTVAPRMRGRVMALYVLVLFGAQAGSGTIMGWIAHTYGAPAAMLACGAGPLAGALVVGLVLARSEGLRTRRRRVWRRTQPDSSIMWT